MGIVLIDAFYVCLKSLPNFHSKNPAAFRLIFMAEIRRCFASNASQHSKHYSNQAFDVRIQEWGCPIFMAKIRQSFVFGALWRIGSVSHLCIWHISTCSYCDESKPLKASSMLMHVTYTRKLMSLGDMDQDKQI